MGSKQTSQANTSSTYSPPPDVLANYQAVTQTAQNVASTPYTAYSGPLVAGLNGQQNAGIGSINSASGIQNGYNALAGGLAGASSQSIDPTQFSAAALSQYENPFQSQVINATQAELNNADAQQASSLQGNAISSGAFGGDRAGIAQAQLAGQQDIANNATIAGLNAQNFNNATSEFNAQQGVNLGAQQNTAARQLAASQQLGTLGNAAQTEALTGAQAQVNAGTLEQTNQQAQDTAAYNQFLQQQAYPFQTTGWLSNIVEGIGSQSGGSSTGQQTTTGGSAGSQILGGLLGLGSFLVPGQPSYVARGGRVPHKAVGGGLAGPYDTMFDPTSGQGINIPTAGSGLGSGSIVPTLNLPVGHTMPQQGQTPAANAGGASGQNNAQQFAQAEKGVSGLAGAFKKTPLGQSLQGQLFGQTVNPSGAPMKLDSAGNPDDNLATGSDNLTSGPADISLDASSGLSSADNSLGGLGGLGGLYAKGGLVLGDGGLMRVGLRHHFDDGGAAGDGGGGGASGPGVGPGGGGGGGHYMGPPQNVQAPAAPVAAPHPISTTPANAASYSVFPVQMSDGSFTTSQDLKQGVGAGIAAPTPVTFQTLALKRGGIVGERKHFDDGGVASNDNLTVDPSVDLSPEGLAKAAMASNAALQPIVPAPSTGYGTLAGSPSPSYGIGSPSPSPQVDAAAPQLANAMNAPTPNSAGDAIVAPQGLGRSTPTPSIAPVTNQNKTLATPAEIAPDTMSDATLTPTIANGGITPPMPPPRPADLGVTPTTNYGGPTALAADGTIVKTDASGNAIDPDTGKTTMGDNPVVGAHVSPVAARGLGQNAGLAIANPMQLGAGAEAPQNGILAGVNPDARGMRNNNPGNLVSNSWTQSLPGYVGSDGRFAIFNTPQQGLSALDRNLQGYGAKGISTPLQIASTWAPSGDGGNNPNAYGGAIAQTLGVGINDKVDMSDPSVRAKIAASIARVENGAGNGAVAYAGGVATPSASSAIDQSAGAPRGGLVANNPTPSQGGIFSNFGHSSTDALTPNAGSGLSSDTPHSGLLGLNFSDAQRQAMLAAGLGMLAGTSKSAFVNIGQGGLQGLAAYNNARNLASEMALRQAQTSKANAEIPWLGPEKAAQIRLQGAQADNADSEAKLRDMQVKNMQSWFAKHAQQQKAGADEVAKTVESPSAPSAIAPASSQPAQAPTVSAGHQNLATQSASSPVVAPTALTRGVAAATPDANQGALQSPTATQEPGMPPAGSRPSPNYDIDNIAKQQQELTEAAMSSVPGAQAGLEALNTRLSAVKSGEPIPYVDGSGRVVGYFKPPGVLDAETAASVRKKYAESPNVDIATGAEYLNSPGYVAPKNGEAPSVLKAQAPFSIDPDTAAVKTSIPSAPKGGGYIVPNVPTGAKIIADPSANKSLREEDAKFLGNQIEGMKSTDSSIARSQALAQAFKMFESGQLVDKIHAGQTIALALGQPGIAKTISSGDAAGMEWVQKEGINGVLDTLKAATPRFAQSEFNAISQKGVPNLTNQPSSNHELVSEMLAIGQRNRDFQRDWETAKQQGWASPSAFYTSWSQANPQEGYIKAAQRQIGNFQGMPLPEPQDWAAGAIYVAPKQLLPATAGVLTPYGVQPGSIFRYNGRGAARLVEPISPSNAFSAQLAPQP